MENNNKEFLSEREMLISELNKQKTENEGLKARLKQIEADFYYYGFWEEYHKDDKEESISEDTKNGEKS